MDMKLLTSSLILLAAFGSSVWNLHVKQSKNSVLFVTLMVLPQLIVALPLTVIFPIQSITTLAFLLASSLVHTGYIIFLVHAYCSGMLSRVFPLAIGMATIISLLFWHIILWHRLMSYEYLGVALVTIGVISFIFIRNNHNQPINLRALIYALGTSVFIFAYTSIDTYGIRSVEQPISYISGLFTIKGLMLLVPMYISRKLDWQSIKNTKNYIIAGLLAGFGYAVAVYAFIYSPTSVVLALRSTSIFFVYILAIFVLKEMNKKYLFFFTIIIFLGVFLILAS